MKHILVVGDTRASHQVGIKHLKYLIFTSSQTQKHAYMRLLEQKWRMLEHVFPPTSSLWKLTPFLCSIAKNPYLSVYTYMYQGFIQAL